jgi:hypothetical protein
VEVEQLFVECLPRLRRLAPFARHPRGVGDAGAVAQPMGSSVEAVVGRGRLDAVGQPPAEGGRARDFDLSDLSVLAGWGIRSGATAQLARATKENPARAGLSGSGEGGIRTRDGALNPILA